MSTLGTEIWYSYRVDNLKDSRNLTIVIYLGPKYILLLSNHSYRQYSYGESLLYILCV